MTKAATLGELKKSPWKSRSIKKELKENLENKLSKGEAVFTGIIAYDETVLPDVYRAILSEHDFILLGLRGQAKTQILRELPVLLDEWQPCLADSPLLEDPYFPVTPQGKAIVENEGDAAKISWRHREDRYGEKLATPDVSMADLIGDIDPIKAARDKLDLSHPEVIHWGIIPRFHRGIFAINELPDLQTRIQVGLFNILEEKDIQLRGFPLRLPLDVLMVFSANPEDYTNRGTIITPLKDRIDSQILTHYPVEIQEAIAITDMRVPDKTERPMPYFLKEIIEEIAFSARGSEYVDDSSGVSARLSIAARELLESARQLRSLSQGKESFYRICDLYSLIPAITGKVELVHEGDQEGSTKVARHLIGQAIVSVFERYFEDFPAQKPAKNRSPEEEEIVDLGVYTELIRWFSEGQQVSVSNTDKEESYRQALDKVPGLATLVKSQLKISEVEQIFLAMEWLLDAMYYKQKISRKEEGRHRVYLDFYSSMFKGLSS